MGIFDWLRRPEPLIASPIRRVAPDPALMDALLQQLRSAQPGLRILELGCGEGGLSLRVAHAAAGCSLLGLDASTDAVRSANTTAREAGFGDRATFRVSDLRTLPVADGAFDCVLGVGALSDSLAPAVMLREIRRVLALGGTAILFEPLLRAEPTEAEPAAPHVRGAQFSAATLRRLIQSSTFATAARLTAPEARGRDSFAKLELRRLGG